MGTRQSTPRSPSTTSGPGTSPFEDPLLGHPHGESSAGPVLPLLSGSEHATPRLASDGQPVKGTAAAEMMLGPDLVTEPRGTTKLTLFSMHKSYRQRQEDFSFQAGLSSLTLTSQKGEGAASLAAQGRDALLHSRNPLCFPAASLTATLHDCLPCSLKQAEALKENCCLKSGTREGHPASLCIGGLLTSHHTPQATATTFAAKFTCSQGGYTGLGAGQLQPAEPSHHCPWASSSPCSKTEAATERPTRSKEGNWGSTLTGPTAPASPTQQSQLAPIQGAK